MSPSPGQDSNASPDGLAGDGSATTSTTQSHSAKGCGTARDVRLTSWAGIGPEAVAEARSRFGTLLQVLPEAAARVSWGGPIGLAIRVAGAAGGPGLTPVAAAELQRRAVVR